jgi:hypothetical protein
MKKQLNTLAIIVTLITATFSNVIANDSTDAKFESKTTTEIVNTLSKKGKKIVKKNAKDLEMYLSVMDLYENTPARFYNLDENTQKNFFAAASQLNESLSSSKRKDVKQLASSVDFNSAISKYIWNVKKSSAVIIPLTISQVKETNI